MRSRAFLTKVATGFVKKKCYSKAIERGFDLIKTLLAPVSAI
jgi:pyruvate/oxaloacetate carboxyltransferase